MNLSQTNKVDHNEQPITKQTYAAPVLEKHGNVESLTQFIHVSPSGPIKYDR